MEYRHQDIKNALTYKGYTTTLTLIVDENIIVGKLNDIQDTITFKANTIQDCEREFKQAVDDFLADCDEACRALQEQEFKQAVDDFLANNADIGRTSQVQTLAVQKQLVRSFRKKPVVIQACQFIYTPDGIKVLTNFCGDALGNISKARHPTAKAEAEIKTLEDGKYTRVVHVATEGDWIIKGVQGEFYACKPDIFVATYEEVQP